MGTRDGEKNLRMVHHDFCIHLCVYSFPKKVGTSDGELKRPTGEIE